MTIKPALRLPLPIGGVLPHLHPFDVPPDALMSAQNWIRRGARLQTREGLQTFADDIDERPLGFIQYDADSEDGRIVMGTNLGWHRYNTGTGLWVDITGGTALTGGNAAQVVFRTMEKSGTTYLLGCNGVDAPKKWDGNVANPYASIGGSPLTATCMVVCFDRLVVAAGIEVEYSDNSDFDAGYSSSVLLDDSPGDIVTMLEEGNLSFAIFKTDSIYRGLAQADLLAPFRFELIASGVPGPVAPNACFHLPDGSMVYLAETGAVMRYDGVRVESLGEHIQYHIEQAMLDDQLNRSWGFFNHAKGEMYFIFSHKGTEDPNAGVMIRWPDLTLWPVRYPYNSLTAGGWMDITTDTLIGDLEGNIGEQTVDIGDYSSSEGSMIFGDSGGQAYAAAGAKDGSNGIAQRLESGFFDFGDGRLMKTFMEAEWWFPQAMGLASEIDRFNIYIGKDDIGDDPEYDAGYEIDLTTTTRRRTHHRWTGRRFNYKFDSETELPVSFAGGAAIAAMRGYR